LGLSSYLGSFDLYAKPDSKPEKDLSSNEATWIISDRGNKAKSQTDTT